MSLKIDFETTILALFDRFEKKSFEYVDSWPKFLLFKTHHLYNSTTELILRLDDCGQITGRLFKNIATRFFLEKRAAKIHETIVGILKNTSEYVGVIQNMKNETDHVALSRAFKKFHDFQALKKFLLKGKHTVILPY